MNVEKNYPNNHGLVERLDTRGRTGKLGTRSDPGISRKNKKQTKLCVKVRQWV